MLRLSETIKMAKFALVGGLNTGVDFAVFTILVYAIGLPVWLSQLLAYSCGVLNSFILNRNWTFQAKSQSSPAAFFKFIAVNLFSFGAATGVLLLLQESANWSPLLAKLVSVSASLAVNYVGTRWWVFRKSSEPGRT